jgi:hypothetical protein
VALGLTLAAGGCDGIFGVSDLSVAETPSATNPVGALCSVREECVSNACEGGVCCDRGCGGPCQRCDADGAAGTCQTYPPGPSPEGNCAMCDGSGSCVSGSTSWQLDHGDDSEQKAHDVVISDDWSVVAGAHSGTVDYGYGTMDGQGGRDVLTLWVHRDGYVSWSAVYGGPGDEEALAVARGPVDGMFAGYSTGGIDLGGGAVDTAGGEDVLVMALDFDGTVAWGGLYGGPGNDRAWAAGYDADNDRAVIGGEFSESIDFGGDARTTAGGRAGFLAAFDADGSHRWDVAMAGSGSATVRSLAVGSGGDVFVAGWFSGSIDFGDGPLTSAGGDDVFVAAYDEDGELVFAVPFGGDGDQRAHALALGFSGGLTVVGELAGSMQVAGDTLASAGLRDAFVLRLDDEDASPSWTARYGDADDQRATAVTVDRQGNVVLAGELEGSIAFGTEVARAPGRRDAFVAKINASGEPLWSRAFGEPGNDSLQRVAAVFADNSRQITAVGSFEGTVDFGDGDVSSSGGEDLLILRLRQ